MPQMQDAVAADGARETARRPRRGPLREAQKELTRCRLMQAGLEVFMDRGFDAATVEEITERANAGRTTFYTHFQTKSEIAVAIAIEETKSLNEEVARLGQTDPTSTASLSRWLTRMEKHYEKDALLVTIVMQHSEVTQKFLEVQEGSARQAVAAWLAAGWTTMVSETDAAEHVRLIMQMVNRWLYLHVVHEMPKPARSREILLQHIHFILERILAHAST